jgi:hypothetical protein
MLRAAETRYTEAARLSAAAVVLAGNAWDAVPLGSLDSWSPAQLAARIAALQLLVAQVADGYLDAVLAEQDITSDVVGAVNARQIAGVAGDGRSLTTLLDEPRIQAKTLIGEGVGARQAWESARNSVRLMSVTAVQDAGRAADSVAMVARPSVDGYVRMLNTPSCSRCVVLAGRFYKWNTGFQRHPKCDCRHVPSNEAVSSDLLFDSRKAFDAGQVTGLSRADAQAVADGADLAKVTNATRGMYTADRFGVKATTEAASGTLRLRPEAIYTVANGDREEALRLLRRFGYLLSTSPPARGGHRSEGAAVMADETSTEGATLTTGSVTEQAGVEATEAEVKPDIPKEVQAALRKANKEAETLRLKLKEIEDRDKTEAQKLAERVTAAEQERDALKLTAMRQRIALEKGLPPQLADRLKGSTEDEMSEDAEALLALVPAASDSAFPGPRPDLSQGARSAMALNGDPLLQSVKNVLGIR